MYLLQKAECVFCCLCIASSKDFVLMLVILNVCRSVASVGLDASWWRVVVHVVGGAVRVDGNDWYGGWWWLLVSGGDW